MSTLQVRDVPADVSRILKARAAEEGQSLSEYALRVLEREARKPSRAELLARLAARPAIELDEPPAATVRRMRDGDVRT